MAASQCIFEDTIGIATSRGNIYGTFVVPEEAWGAVIFAHGSGTSRRSPRNLILAEMLHNVGLATLLVDLLTLGEERIDQFTAQHRFDIDLLTDRLLAATDWVEHNCSQYNFRLGYFGAALGQPRHSKRQPMREEIAAVVSRGGRPDLVGAELGFVRAATLLIVGGLDRPAIELNQTALDQLQLACRKEMAVVPGATHLFEEMGALEEVSQLAAQWFVRHLGASIAYRKNQIAQRSVRTRRTSFIELPQRRQAGMNCPLAVQTFSISTQMPPARIARWMGVNHSSFFQRRRSDSQSCISSRRL